MNGATSKGLSAFHCTPYSRIPSATAATAIVGKLRSRPITKAASASTKPETESAPPIGTPRIPERKKRAKNDSADANIHTMVESQPTGMPRRAARSLRSAAARTAMPTCVFERNNPTAIIASGARIMAMRSLAFRMNVPTVSFQATGGGILSEAATSSHKRGKIIANTVSS